MNAEQAIEYIHSVCWKGSIPGLGRTRNLLDLMGNPQNKLKYVHIAGTNGKGSTAAMTASILQKAGYRVGLYTSPYIYRFNERMQIDGEPISDEELAEITAWVKPKAQSMEESPTEFELVSCIAFEYFMRNRCDIVVLEAGDMVVADGRILENFSLQVNESSLTGESTNVDKQDVVLTPNTGETVDVAIIEAKYAELPEG